MSGPTDWTERRQFGRRPLIADAVAQLPGAVEVACVIENLSEGGALLSFPSGVAPINYFDLVVEGFPLRLPCEMRYQVGVRFGVRFRRVEQGEALVGHFFGPAVAPARIENDARRAPDSAPAAKLSIRQLRETMLPVIAPEPRSQVPTARAPVEDSMRGVKAPVPDIQMPAISGRPARLISRRRDS